LAGDFFAAVFVAAGTCASWVMKPDTASELSASVDGPEVAPLLHMILATIEARGKQIRQSIGACRNRVSRHSCSTCTGASPADPLVLLGIRHISNAEAEEDRREK
jgi:hypothetical protein